MVEDKRIEHLQRISLDSSRVDLSSPIVFLCGGEVDVRNPFGGSVRDGVLSLLSSNRPHWSIILAEHFKDWVADSVYHDLVSFEDDLASISSLVVLILESPGALTELGLFARHEYLSKKLHVIVNDEHYNQSSFIRLGPLRHLERHNSKSVCAYPWDDKNPPSLKSILPEICQDITECLSNLDRTEAFSISNNGHLAFLVFEIVKLYRALKFTEIETCLTALSVPINREKLRRILFLLNKLSLVSSIKRGNQDYYWACSDVPKINLAKLDYVKAKMAAMQFYALNQNERQRLEVIKSVYPDPNPATSEKKERAAV